MGRNAIWVVASMGAERWVGRLVPGPTDRIHVHFVDDKGPAYVPLGTPMAIGVATAGMTAPVRQEGRLVRVDWRREEVLECVFEFDEPAWLLQQVQGAVIDYRERRHAREFVEPETVVCVPVMLPDAPPSARRYAAHLIDRSAGGLGLALPRAAESVLCTQRHMRATVPVPETGAPAVWVCDIRYRIVLDAHRVRYGAQFVSDGLAVDPPGVLLEALWDCQVCGAEALLADSHAHCPNCGASRHGHEREPTWRDQATFDDHRYGGMEVACDACGVAHGPRASYCGNCGSPLGEDVSDAATYRSAGFAPDRTSGPQQTGDVVRGDLETMQLQQGAPDARDSGLTDVGELVAGGRLGEDEGHR